MTLEPNTQHQTMPIDPNLQSHNTRPNLPRGASSQIDLPVQPVTADIAYSALVRLEAKIDAIGAQQTWTNGKLQAFEAAAQSFIASAKQHPMLSKMMGGDRG